MACQLASQVHTSRADAVDIGRRAPVSVDVDASDDPMDLGECKESHEANQSNQSNQSDESDEAKEVDESHHAAKSASPLTGGHVNPARLSPSPPLPPPPCDRLLYVAQSDLECGGRRAGLGLFTLSDLPAGEFIGRYNGAKITQKSLEQRAAKGSVEHNAYLMDVRSDRTQRLLHIIDAKGTGDDNVCKFVNTIVDIDQADQVNALFELHWVPLGAGGRQEAQVWLRTTKPIRARQEIITDYGESRMDIVFPPDARTLPQQQQQPQ